MRRPSALSQNGLPFPEREIAPYTDALGVAVEAMEVDPAERNILVTHQFVTGAARCDWEEDIRRGDGQCGCVGVWAL